MEQIEKQVQVSLPEGLRKQFQALRRRLWVFETATAVSWGVGGLLFSYLVLFFSDRVWDTPVWVRIIIWVAGFTVFGWAAARWIAIWILRPRDLRALARLVQKKYRRLGDRLLGIVELSNEAQRPANFSPALYRAAIQQVSVEASEFDFEEAVNIRPLRRYGMVLLLLAGLLVLPLLVAPEAVQNAFARWIIPTSSVARYTLVRLEGTSGQEIVPHGEPFEVGASVRYLSFWKPTLARARYDSQPSIAGRVESAFLRINVPGQVQAGELTVRLGDARHRFAIKPTLRPSLVELSASVQLPDYLRYDPIVEKAQSGSLTLLEGSRVQFAGKASRTLRTAELLSEIGEPAQLKIEGEQFLSDLIQIDAPKLLLFAWKDALGLSNSAPWRLNVEMKNDLPPVPELVELPRDLAILESEVLELKTMGRDDFGVRDLGLSWTVIAGIEQTNSYQKIDFKVTAPTSREKRFEKAFHFSPAVLRIPADSTIEIRAYATDFYPDRPPAESPIYRLLILGNERHAEMVRQRLESLLNRLEEVTRLQEKVANNTREMESLPKEQLGTDETKQRLESTKEDQTQNAANLEQMAKEGMRTLREALRNPTLSPEMLREWAQNLQEMQQISENQMQQAATSLKAAQQSSSAESQAQELSNALQKEEEAMRALEKMQNQVNQGLDKLQAWTLAQRLRKLSGEEKKIETQIQKSVAETIGLMPNELPPRFQRANESLAKSQSTSQKDTEVLQGEISRFFERTQRPNYGAVSKEMTEARTTEEMDRVRGLIQENIGMEAIQNLANWSDRFKHWADKLEPKKDGGSGGQGSGGGEGNEANELLEKLIALLRLREGQVNLREQTQMVERQKADASFYAEAAERLVGDQNQLLIGLHDVQRDNPLKDIDLLLQQGNETMQETRSLLAKPQTDEVTTKEETRTVELLSDAINLIVENSKQSEGSEGGGESEMAMVMQMMAPAGSMGVGMSPTGGGNMAGGTTDRANMPTPGDAEGKPGEGRSVNKASGVTQNLPTEFRDALQNYFNAIEQEKN